MTLEPPRIVNDVSYVTRVKHASPSVWQAQYLVKVKRHFLWQAQHLEWYFVVQGSTGVVLCSTG